MTQYDNTNTGVLFINDKKGNDKAPDRKGTININGVEMDIAGWMRTGKDNGTPFLSLKVSPKWNKDNQDTQPVDNSNDMD